MLNLPVIYRESLKIYKGSGQYERDLLLGMNTNIIPVSDSSIYYHMGIRAIESVLDSYYNIYVDLSFLFNDSLKSCVSDSSIHVISNDLGIRCGDIVYRDNLLFFIDMSNFRYLLYVSDDFSFVRYKLLNMYESHIQLVYMSEIIYLSLSPNDFNLSEDLGILNYLLSYVTDDNFNLVIYGGLSSRDIMLKYLTILFSLLSVYPVVINYHFLSSSMGDSVVRLENLCNNMLEIKSSVIYSNVSSDYYRPYLSLDNSSVCSCVIKGLDGNRWCVYDYKV